MTRHSLLVLLAASLVLAGCTTGPLAPFDDDQPGENALSGTPPGVTDGRLANASALVEAHETSLEVTGFAAHVTQSVGEREVVSYDLVVTAGRSHYALSGNRSTGENTTVEIDLWANESHRVGRFRSGGESRYHASRRGADSFTPLAVLGRYLHAGTFTVTNVTAEGYTVLTADDYVPPEAGANRSRDVDSFSARAVVDETGRIHELTVTVERGRREELYTFELQRTGVASLERPAWVDEVPATAFLSPKLTVDVENGTLLTIRNEGDDAVPANATLTLTTNDTTYRATFDGALEPGEIQYAAITADDGTLRLTAERPAPTDVRALTSPVSVTIETASGVTLHSGSFGWESTSASGDGSESSRSSSGSGSGSD